MDNRRVAKAYRDRHSREKVLPYPTPNGLLSKMKRYLSGGALVSRVASRQTSATQPDVSMNNSGFVLPDSFTAAANTTLEAGDSAPNRVLSQFFQDKGDHPLSQVEYEGVMSLLERSKANITLPLPDRTAEAPAAEEPHTLHSNKIAPYSQKTLKNTSMYDANSSSFVTPDYKPVYHTFSDNTSRGNISVKRVYQFSGLPSPYRTRIKAPNLAARRAKRIASSAAPSTTGVSIDTPVETMDSFSSKPRSKAANSLLSILDGNKASSAQSTGSTHKPLHNTHTRYKRKSTATEGPAQKKSVLNASDISKTVLYNKAEALDENEKTPSNGVAEEKESGLFSSNNGDKKADSESSEPKKSADEKDASSEPRSTAPLFSFGKPSEPSTTGSLFGNSKASENKPAFLFGKSVTGEKQESAASELDKLSNDSAKENKPAFNFGSAPSQFLFGKASDKTEKSTGSSASPLFNFGSASEPAAPKFTFGTKTAEVAKEEVQKSEPAKNAEPVSSFSLTASKEPKAGFSFGSKSGLPKFNFGSAVNNAPEVAKDEKETPAALPFRIGVPVEKPSISFGTKPEKKSVSEESSKEIKPAFSFGLSSYGGEPPLKFGADTKSEPAFNFGRKAEADSNSTGSTLGSSGPVSFGTKSSSLDPQPAFTFGSTKVSFSNGETASKPAFSFGSSANGDDSASKPKTLAFSFGSNGTLASADNKSVPNQQPAFSFGTKPAESTTQVESQSEAKNDNSVAAKPLFQNLTAPAFNFGAKSTVNTANGHSSDEFEFPEVKTLDAPVDAASVTKYESLFEF